MQCNKAWFCNLHGGHWICRYDKIFICGYAGSCQNDNFLCNQLRKLDLSPGMYLNGISKTESAYYRHLFHSSTFLVYLQNNANHTGPDLGHNCVSRCPGTSLQWRHNERDGVSNHRRLDYLLKRLLSRRSKKTSKLRVTGLCEWNPPMTGGFPPQKASSAENVSIWWCHYVMMLAIGTHSANYNLDMFSSKLLLLSMVSEPSLNWCRHLKWPTSHRISRHFEY